MGAIQNRAAYRVGERDLSKNPLRQRHPSEYKWDYEESFLETEKDVKLNVWFMKQKNYKECPTLVYFHGICRNIGEQLPEVNEHFKRCGINILLIEHRGFGYSTGSPSQEGIKHDLRVIADHLNDHPDIDKTKIFILGYSFGGGCATYLTSQIKFQPLGLLLIATFTRMDKVAAERTIFLVEYIFTNRWKSIELVPEFTCPVFVMNGTEDQVIRPYHSQELYDAAVKAKFRMKVSIEGGKHGFLYRYNKEKYYGGVKEFVDRCLKEAKE